MIDFLMAHGSYLGIIVFLILTGAGLPLPEEVAIVAAGVLSSLGHLNVWLALAACLFGALTGDCVMYWIGHHFGRRVLREHHWWNRFVKPEREAQMERMLQDHGFKVLFLARFLVGIRSPVYLSAGILRMPFWRFMLIDLFCATSVICTFFWLSYFIGDRVYVWIHRGEWVLTGIVAVVVVIVAFYFWRRHKRRVAEEEEVQLLEASSGDEMPNEQLDDEASQRVADWSDTTNGPPVLVSDRMASKVVSENSPARRAP